VWRGGGRKVEATAKLLMNVSDASNSDEILSELNELERKQVEKVLGQLFFFNPHCPTGRYRLNLAIPVRCTVTLCVPVVPRPHLLSPLILCIAPRASDGAARRATNRRDQPTRAQRAPHGDAQERPQPEGELGEL
jgi:hypothetical protein